MHAAADPRRAILRRPMHVLGRYLKRLILSMPSVEKQLKAEGKPVNCQHYGMEFATRVLFELSWRWMETAFLLRDMFQA